MVDVRQPLDPAVAKRLIRDILTAGIYRLTDHAIAELAKDKLTSVDAVNVLRGGVVEPAEWVHGEWRYRVRTALMYVVVALVSDTELVVVTGWRVRR